MRQFSRHDKRHLVQQTSFFDVVYYLLVAAVRVERSAMVEARRAHSHLRTHPHNFLRFEFLDSGFDFDSQMSAVVSAGGVTVYRA